MNKKFSSSFVVACTIILLVSISRPALATTSTNSLNSTSSYLVKGETTTLKVEGVSKKATWTSTNKQIATVSSTGKVTAVAYGTVTIKATVNKKAYKYYITVIDPSLIKIIPSSTEVVVNGDAVSLNPSSDIYSASALKKMGITYKMSGNAGVTVSGTGKIKATEAGSFKVTAYVHGNKIESISMNAVVFNGFTEPSVSIIPTGTKYITFADEYTPVLDGVIATSSDNSIATVSLTPIVTMESDVDHCDGIEIKGIKDGTATITVTYAGIAKEIQVIVGAGVAILSPVDAVKTNNYSGYKGEALTTLKWIRDFIDTNNLLSTTMSDREKVTIIQTYLNRTANSNTGDTLYNSIIAQVLFDGVGLCGPYAETFCLLCECIGIEVYYCYGTGTSDLRTDKWLAHAWNKVKIDNVWYYIDPTWCSNLNDLKRYFLTETLWSDHRLTEEDTYIKLFKNPGFDIYINGLY
jgi:transglutaminase/protease-like cytokinesis protein 3